MEEPNQGLQAAADQALQEVLPEAGTTQNNNQQQQQETNKPVVDNKLQELESQLQAERTRAQNLEQLARQQQSRADQYRQQVQALAGTTPQADPLEAKAASYASQFNLNKEDAKAVLAMVRAEFAPIQQQYQQQTQALQATTMVNDVMQQAYSQDPSLFPSDQVYAAVQAQVREMALQGNAQYVNPDYVLDVAAIEAARLARANRANPSANQPISVRPQQYPQAHQQSIPSMMGQGSGFRPAMPQPQQRPNAPLVDKLANDMEAYWNPNYKQPNQQ